MCSLREGGRTKEEGKRSKRRLLLFMYQSVVLSTEVIIHNALGLYAKTVEHLNDSV